MGALHNPQFTFTSVTYQTVTYTMIFAVSGYILLKEPRMEHIQNAND